VSPTVSVMMAAYNTREYIEQAVQSVLSQTFKDFELLIIDDGSTDGTGEFLRALATIDSRIRLTSRPNAGIVLTRNELLGMAQGEFVAVLDSDDISPPRRLELSVDYLRRHPQTLAVGGAMKVIDPDGALLSEWQLRRSHQEVDSALMQSQGIAICHSAATIRRQELLEIGGYRDPLGFGQAEDLDMWLRLSERGPVVNLPDIMVQYRVRLSSASVGGAEQQAAAGRAAIAEARKRRNISSPLPHAPTDRIATKAEVFLRWGWWALGSGHVITARKHATHALLENPFSPKIWKLMLCALRGY